MLAENMLARVYPDVWRHTVTVTSKVRTLADVTAGVNDARFDLGLPANRFTLISAAFLHDIGHSSRIADTGLPALDAARYLRAEGWSVEVCNLVANNGIARFEAEERGLADELRQEFPYEPTPASDALLFADLTISHDGHRYLTFKERLAEIRALYNPQHVVARAWDRAEPVVEEAVGRAYQRCLQR